jgi:hypothetical protein
MRNSGCIGAMRAWSIAFVLALIAAAAPLGTPAAAAPAGAGDPSLVAHYYRSILRREPDAAGAAFWQGEASRVAALGADPNEVWYAMATTFFASPEYAAFGRDDAGFVTDLYAAFFDRAPDAGGFAHWTGQLAAGMPREVALAGFLFSPEFTAFTRAISGTPVVRREVDAVMDMFRGFLARLPDDQGFRDWVGALRTAQCRGTAALASQVDGTSSKFAGSEEYARRARTDPQYVGDLYNAFLRRGGDLEGVRFWIGQLASGAQSREQVRQAFFASPEFRARLQAVAAESCLLPGYVVDHDAWGKVIPAPSGPAGASMCEQPGQPPYPGAGGRGPCGSFEIPVGECGAGMTGENAITRAFLYVLEDYQPGGARIGNSIRFGLQRDHAMVFRMRTGDEGLFSLPRYLTLGYEEQSNRGPLAPRFVTLSEKRCDFDYSKTLAAGKLDGCFKTMTGGDSLLAKIWAPGSVPAPTADFPYCPLKPNTTYYLNIRYEDASKASTRGRISCPAGVNAFNTCGQTIGIN